MLRGDALKGELTLASGVENDELVTAKQLFATHLKVDERAKQLYRNFNVEEYVLEVMRSKETEKKGDGEEVKSGKLEDAKEVEGGGGENGGAENVDKAKNINDTRRGNESDNANEADNEDSAGDDTDCEYPKRDEQAYREELQFLKSNPLHLSRWYDFLEMYQREEVYELFLLVFPRCTLYWTKYAELKIKKKEYTEAYKIYRRCIDANIYDLKLIFSFLYFTYHTSSIHEYISFLFEGLKYVGTDIKSSTIWVELLYILIKINNTNLIVNNDIHNLLFDPFRNISCKKRNEGPLLPSEREQAIFSSSIPNKGGKTVTYTEHYTSDGKLRKFYHCWFNNPTKYLDKVWKSYCSYEKTMTDNFTVSSLSSYNTQYLNGKNAYRELCALYEELNLDRKFKIDKKFKLIIPISRKYKVENCILLRRWEKIINYEKENPLKLSLPLVRKRIMYVYEQALVHLQFNADLWFSYFQFLLLSKKFSYAIRIMREAIEVYLPFDELLKLNFAYFFERHALINQAHFVYQLMLGGVSKRKKQFSLSFLHSKEGFRKRSLGLVKKRAGKRKRKGTLKGGTSKRGESSEVESLNRGDDLHNSRNDEERKKGKKRVKAEGPSRGQVLPPSDDIYNGGSDDNNGKSEESNEGSNGEEDLNDRPSEEVSGTTAGDAREAPRTCEDDIKEKFLHCDYEKIEERKKYFINYINVNKKKRREFVFTHFLNFVKRNYDETIWRYYTEIVLSEKRCSQYIYYYCANMEKTFFKNEKRAIYIMNEGYKKYASNKQFLLLYVKLLLERGNIDEIRSLIYKFIHNLYADFYKKYDSQNSTSGRKGSRGKSGQGEFNQFDSNYLKLLRKKNKACDKLWTLLMQLETLYGDISNLNRIWETKLKYESGYNLEENKNVLIDFDNVSNVNEHMFVEDSTLTDILCKGYLENLKKNDIDNLQFKVNLISSQQFGGASLKKTFSFFQVSGENVFTELLTGNENVINVQDGARKKKKALRQEGEKEQKQEDDNPTRPFQSEGNKEHISESEMSENCNANRNKNQNNQKEEGDASGINNDQLRNIPPLKKEKKLSARRGTVKSAYDSFNFLDSRTRVKKEKKKIHNKVAGSTKNEGSKTEEKADMITDTVSSISRPNLKKMLLYKPLENYDHLEVDGGKLHSGENISLGEYPYCVSDMNRNDDKNYFFKREYFSMPNIINDFLSLLPEENGGLNVSDSSIDYLIASLKKLTIPKLETFPYEPIPVKEIIQIKKELNG
ncbi:conserved Plasmodium protein, unknown function [Plasmodium knowlesi strain H]|uniref:Suppressor of forked domain-containing protein n=3 Tax=Plasmodium knowlesi TaxID=5850 RepID=A0A5K1V5G1_PLAKH|nr:conserved Plasmodium protein, unknown function [Plasmodium knowlesi strain H]OTN67192.1 Uncharacterized protein PKNOH_S07444200 [Plasmodium knowlesi]CAA9988569.1 conserved Plasmodium protein, unknown function [Plasmodium knowlesi strain H]SBO21371.1 conserved Plasmodium protein, unknown function [Plasmodium knowlesi strain H]SBO21827.1 conserved Plasmodium protein, unknown function [Plasmodium knowlesi strain H]VVS78043.1 conserved Plasmodium protein, unknown function [Plasmodium knowlesi s|eukprot:XP_002259545.1 hypothetical protein, conserved in Plasmodium species [Plasmodium knowlesi strain H]